MKYYIEIIMHGIYCTCEISGRGGASIYGKEFDDELTSELKHTGKLL